MSNMVELGQRDGWIASLDWVIGVLDEEIQFQIDHGKAYSQGESIKSLERLQMIYNNRRKAWMLYD